MGQIKVEKNVGGIEGLCVIDPAVHGDARGYFMETYNLETFHKHGLDMEFGTWTDGLAFGAPLPIGRGYGLPDCLRIAATVQPVVSTNHADQQGKDHRETGR